jgi:hypothetical protein
VWFLVPPAPESLTNQSRASFRPDSRRSRRHGAAADRGEDERADHQAATTVNAVAGDRFNGSFETQPCAGTIRARAKSGKKQASEADNRSTSARIAVALSRQSQNEAALGRAGGHQAKQRGVIALVDRLARRGKSCRSIGRFMHSTGFCVPWPVSDFIGLSICHNVDCFRSPAQCPVRPSRTT